MKQRLVGGKIFTTIVLTLVSPAVARAANLQMLGPSGSYVAGVSANGQVLFGEYGPNYIAESVVFWTLQGVATPVATGGIDDSLNPAAISANGLVGVGVVTGLSSSYLTQFTTRAGAQNLTPINGFASGVNADGSVIIGAQLIGLPSANDQAFKWTAQTGLVPLPSLPGFTNTRAQAIDYAGDVIVGSLNTSSGGFGIASVWRGAAAPVLLGTLPGDTQSVATGVSADGAKITGDSSGPFVPGPNPPGQAFLWTAAKGMIGLGVLPGQVSSQATAISGDGNEVIGVSVPATATYGLGFVWDPVYGMQDFANILNSEYGVNTAGLVLQPNSLSYDGSTIAGEAYTSVYLPGQAFVVSGFLPNRYVDTTFAAAAGAQTAIGMLGGPGVVTIGAGGSLSVGGNNTSSDAVLYPNSVFTGTITGAGDLIKAGTGVWLFGGGLQTTGGLYINGGAFRLAATNALAGPNPVMIASGATLDLNGFAATVGGLSGGGAVTLGSANLTIDGSGLFSGSISGTGGLTVAGGIETLSGTDAYSGQTTVSGASLVLNGALPNSTVVVGAGGSLKGSGVAANLLIASGGVLSPGGATAIGQIASTGALTLSPGSIYQVKANASGQSDTAAVGGTASVTGASVQVLAAPGTYARNTAYTILTAAGGVSGSFAGVTSNLAFLTPSLNYSNTAVNLTLSNNQIPFQSVAVTQNQIATATALYNSNPASVLFNAVLLQSNAGAQQAFNALSGELYANAPAVQLYETHYVRDAILGRLSEDENDLGVGSLRLSAWAQVIGAWSRGASQDGGVLPTHADTGGAMVGADALVGAWRIGVAAAQLDTHINLPDVSSEDSVESTHASIYAGGPVFGPLKARIGFDYGWNDIYSSRSVIFPGFLNLLGAHYASETDDVFGELVYRLRYGRLSFDPYADLAYVRVNTDGVNEAGGPAALKIAANSIDAEFTDLGVRTRTSFNVSATASLQPYLNLAWRHVYGDAEATTAATFLSTGVPFSIKGAALDHDAADIETGVTFTSDLGVMLTAAYIGQISSDWQDHQAKLSLKWMF